MNALRRAVLALPALLTVLYPLAVFAGAEHVHPTVFVVALGALWLARAWLAGAPSQMLPILALTALGTAYTSLHADTASLRWYPVAVNAIALATFFASLFVGRPVVERLARLTEPDLPEHAVAYTRLVTIAWCVFFAVNGTIATWTVLGASLRTWTLYNGLVSYLLMGAFFAVEYGVRQRVRAANE